MTLTRLSLTNFRNYADAVIVAEPGFVILTGENGAGKTNVLEAISLLSPGRGLRGATLAEMARQDGPGGFAVAAKIMPAPDALDLIDLGTGTSAAAPDKRQVRINATPAAATLLSEWLSVLWLTPVMDRLFQEGAAGRRRFLDRLVLALDPGHAVHSARYEAAMRARNKLLSEEKGWDETWLAALEVRMAEHGTAIVSARAAAVEALNERMAAIPETAFARARLELEGGTEELARLDRHRPQDAAAGRTLIGPHRTDLVVTHEGKQQRAEQCSTGEQKALLIGIVLAHAEMVAERTGRPPVLLFDEIAAHLDRFRRATLFERLAAAGGQVWMTGTERSLFSGAPSEATWLEVSNGEIRVA